jgi:hypothetical protein
MEKKIVSAKEADEVQIIIPNKPVDAGSSSKGSSSKKANILENKKSLMIFASIALLLVILFLVYSLFMSSPYKYSFNINGVDFVSNTYTPSEFFKGFNDKNSFVVSMDVVNNASNSWVVNSMNLWLIALNADKKNTVLVVKNVDLKGNIVNCLTNDSNVLQSRELSADECKLVLSDSNKAQVVVALSNKDQVLLEQNKITVFASGTKTISHVNYYAIKEMYSNFDDILAIINQKIGSIN